VSALLNGIAFAKGGGGFGGGSSSFGGGARSFSAPSFTAPAAKSFSAPSITVAPRAPPPPPVAAPAARAPVVFDSGATRAKATEDSRANFRANSPEAPKPPPAATSTTSTSHTNWADRPIFPSRQAETPRTDYTRPTSSWTPTRTVIVERQVTSSGGTDAYFWLWLMEHNQNQRQRDDWIYHNRDRVSQEQMDELRRRDSGIDARLRKLEEGGVQRDPNFRIPDSDYKDKTVTAPADKPATSSGFKSFWLTIGCLLLFGALIYLVFFKRFNTRRSYA
jgi:hypothetical protein